MNEKDILYVAAAVQPHNITEKNLAAYDSGFFSAQDSAERIGSENRKLKAMEQAHAVRRNLHTEHGREAAARSAEKARLVKGRKSPTGKPDARKTRLSRRLRTLSGQISPVSILSSSESFYNSDALYELGERQHHGKSRVYVLNRPWSEQIKAQMIYQPRPCDAPDANSGDRYSEKLTSRAVRKIFESGAYVATCENGFNTFLTLTFTPEQREKILVNNELTMGAEVSRFLDGIKKIYRRGFDAVISGQNADNRQGDIADFNETEFVEGKSDDFHYIWVAECPQNEDGSPNPHIHVLLSWNVARRHFKTWAERIEGVWGHGYAKLERIKQPKAASAYLIKAVGYAAKGANAEQGVIRGNRYNIARCSRAPAWEVLASFDADNMAAIIKECGYKLERWRKPIERKIYAKKQKKDEFIKAAGVAKEKGDGRTLNKLKRLISTLETECFELKQTIRNRGAFARSDNTFSIVFEGEQAREKMDNFLVWAAGARNWTMNTKDADLSDLQQYAVERYEDEYQRFLETRADWRSQLTQARPHVYSDDEIALAEKQYLETLSHYEIQQITA
ncbi:rolling circle replication-associated protein [Vibrio sp. SCSIO 43137]|uniref:rolling circle replication-associated protein n=1 Tax=Vibrio sp. SCSIO 43137 TaxID=3021011 RepID=UPI002307314A|nr:hypothetical protein [Vibrio sp. SCSIO 43137]WCE31102.1 hypothetical protein PK654_07510 [Vibrio sp. SCSIO 43137]